MRISIIIPVYNGEKYIVRCLQSILRQGLDLYEIIVVNDGSTDDSDLLVNQLAEEHSEIKLINQENQGQAVSRNNAIALAQGKYVYFIDADDYLADEVLNKLLLSAEKNDLELITFQNKVVTDQLITSPEYDRGMGKILAGPEYIKEHNYKNECWWYITRKDFLEELGIRFTKGRFMEDVIFTTNLLLAAHRVARYSIDGYRYVQVESSTLNNKDPKHYEKVIYDTEYLIQEFDQIIKRATSHPEQKKCIPRLKTRRDSFVFFLIIRACKSTLSFKQLWEMLMRIKKTGGYPIKHFVGEEYNKPVYKVLTPVFNNKLALYTFFKTFRILKSK